MIGHRGVSVFSHIVDVSTTYYILYPLLVLLALICLKPSFCKTVIVMFPKICRTEFIYLQLFKIEQDVICDTDYVLLMS